jgi:hypothetical protein
MCFAGAALTIAHHRVREYVYGNICNERWGQYILPVASKKGMVLANESQAYGVAK